MKAFGRIVTFLVYFFLYAPLLVMIFFSFNAGKSTSVFSGFSLRWYRELFSGGGVLMEAMRNSLLLAVLSAVIATLIGTVAAIGLYRLKKGFLSGAILTVNNIPLMNPDIVTGVSMMLLFVFAAGVFGAVNATNFYTAHHLQHPLCDLKRPPQAPPVRPRPLRGGARSRLHPAKGVF